MVGSKHGPKHRGEDGYYDQHGHWWPTTVMLDDAERVMPETVPNDYIRHHRVGCGCEPCGRYPNQRQLRDMKVRASARRRE